MSQNQATRVSANRNLAMGGSGIWVEARGCIAPNLNIMFLLLVMTFIINYFASDAFPYLSAKHPLHEFVAVGFSSLKGVSQQSSLTSIE
jgi:hypothetical protein